MSIRAAVTTAAVIVAVKAVLIAGAWRNWCALMGRCAPPSAWLPFLGVPVGAAIGAAWFVAWRVAGRRGRIVDR